LRDAEREQGAESGGHGSAPPAGGTPSAESEEEAAEQSEKEELAVQREEPQHVLEDIVVSSESVQRFVEVQIHFSYPVKS
jgi:hypothetical protein